MRVIVEYDPYNRLGNRMFQYAFGVLLAKKYNCAIIWMSQLSAEAEGKINVNQSMLEGSKTGKAAEADLMLLISKNPEIEGQDSNDPQRHIRLAKNKLTGWHGTVHVALDVERGIYSA